MSIRIRGLQVQARTVEEVDGDGFRPVSALDAGDQIWTTFEEAVEHEIDLCDAGLDDLVDADRCVDVEWTATARGPAHHRSRRSALGRVVRRPPPGDGPDPTSARAGSTGPTRWRGSVSTSTNTTGWTAEVEAGPRGGLAPVRRR